MEFQWNGIAQNNECHHHIISYHITTTVTYIIPIADVEQRERRTVTGYKEEDIMVDIESNIKKLWKDVKDGLSEKNWNFIAPASGVLFSSFYMLQMISQRAVGSIGIHGGWPTNILAPIGCGITMANIYFSQKVEEKTRAITHGYSSFPNIQSSSHYLTTTTAIDSERVQKRKFLLSFGMFILLERGFFRTVFPSSVISLGVFGNILNKHRYSVPATSELTTEAQRTKIQRLGRLFGCHQCGSRQLGIQGFIADHMPPTRFAKEAEAVWWRRLLRLKVSTLMSSNPCLLSLFITGYDALS